MQFKPIPFTSLSPAGIRGYFRSFLNLVYPDTCLICEQRLTYKESFVCGKCRANLCSLRYPQCEKCSRELPPFLNNGKICTECQQARYHFTRNISALRYDEKTKQLFYHIKFRNRKTVLTVLTPYIDKVFTAMPVELSDCLMTSVPLDNTRRKKRGFNQSKVIAAHIGKRFSIPLDSGLLRRRHPRPPQSTLKRRERLTNLGNTFYVPQPQKVRHRNILLVDDIFTTGTTVDECAGALKRAGAETIHVFTLARALKTV
mgnify:CR=1 FL=1